MNGPIEDGYDAWPQLRRFDRLISYAYRKQLQWADRVIVVTPGLVHYVQQFAGRRDGYAVVGNGADVELFRPRAASTSDAGRPYVVFIGALASWQGIDTVLAATSSPHWPDAVDLVIAGDGVERDRVQEAVRRSPRVRWLGSVPYGEAAAVLAGSIAALVPMNAVPRSQFGLSPLKLFEAMACGVPVVASDLPGLGDVVREHDCGVTFAAGDPAGLAQGLAELVSDPAAARSRGARGRAAALALYSWDARAGQTEEVVLEAAAARRSR